MIDHDRKYIHTDIHVQGDRQAIIRNGIVTWVLGKREHHWSGSVSMRAKSGTIQLQDSAIGDEKGKISTTQADCRQAEPFGESEGKRMIEVKFECLEDLEWICVSKSIEVFQELENWVRIEDIKYLQGWDFRR